MLQSNAETRVRGTKQLKNMAIPQEDSLMEKITTYEHKPFCCTALNDCVDVSDQIRYLYKTRTMSEAVIRLQFFICMLIEKSLEAEIDGLKVLPFGSWSCGFALDGTSDVDVSIVHNHGKGILGHVSHLFDKSSLFDKIAFISRARVPIVKLIQTQTGVSCDICSNGLAGLYTAEILYLLNMYADVFCPLTLAVKVIAKQHSLSESGMSSKYSSFMLTMMVLSYLQQEGILPALKNLNMERHSRSSDSLKKWKETKFRTPKRRLTNICPEKDLGELLVGFFQYYRTFPFKHLIMDPYFGKVVESAHSDHVCIINPFESDHNICRNVSYTEVNRFKDACSKFSEDLVANARKTSDGTCWGLASILQEKKFQLKEKAKLRTNIDMFYNFDYDSIDDVYVSMDGENDSVFFDGKAVNGENLGPNDVKQKQVNDSVDQDLFNNDPFFSRSRRGNKNKKKRYLNKQDTGVKNS
ncbi:poly(A) RNA polymerase, mitochondrial-like isoform X2 [Ruditapes philippinarum]|nr:poly(A) RNA polymerase, mitochondrial-like isoform X2 [Ruditapes philippinarum]